MPRARGLPDLDSLSISLLDCLLPLPMRTTLGLYRNNSTGVAAEKALHMLWLRILSMPRFIASSPASLLLWKRMERAPVPFDPGSEFLTGDWVERIGGAVDGPTFLMAAEGQRLV